MKQTETIIKDQRIMWRITHLAKALHLQICPYYKQGLICPKYKQKKQSHLNIQHLQPIPIEYVRDPEMTPRAIARSITHTGFAQAFFKANQ